MIILHVGNIVEQVFGIYTSQNQSTQETEFIQNIITRQHLLKLTEHSLAYSASMPLSVFVISLRNDTAVSFFSCTAPFSDSEIFMTEENDVFSSRQDLTQI